MSPVLLELLAIGDSLIHIGPHFAEQRLLPEKGNLCYVGRGLPLIRKKDQKKLKKINWTNCIESVH